MVIANPIYDVVFKRLMEDNRIAKFFIGTLLGKTIVAANILCQNSTIKKRISSSDIFRLDFIVTIKTETGELKKVFVEIQKPKHLIDLLRFESYLDEQYRKEDIVKDRTMILPIVKIYLLDFKLPKVETSCLKVVDRVCLDLIDKKVVENKTYFVENLSHDCCIVQTERITDRYLTRLDKLLAIFEQTHFIDNAKITKEFKHEADIEEVKIINDILHHLGTDPVEKKKIETEHEAWRTLDAYTIEFREKAEQQMCELEETKQEIEELKRQLGKK